MIQRFSITRLLFFIPVVALGCLLLKLAIDGVHWAQALMLVVLAAVLWAVVQVVLTLVGFAMMTLAEIGSKEKPQSPFATDTPAPQIISPNQTEND